MASMLFVEVLFWKNAGLAEHLKTGYNWKVSFYQKISVISSSTMGKMMLNAPCNCCPKRSIRGKFCLQSLNFNDGQELMRHFLPGTELFDFPDK